MREKDIVTVLLTKKN